MGIPGDIFKITLPALDAGQCMIPDTMCLSFKFTNSNTKSWFLNNLGRLLVEKLSVDIQGRRVYENVEEGLLEVYKDLWKTEEKRKNMVKYGIANENTRKLMFKDDSANKATKTDGVLDLTVAESKKIMKAQDGKDGGKYKSEDIKLEYDVIDSEDLVREVRDQYNIGRPLGYEYVIHNETQEWAKKETVKSISVSNPTKSMKAVVLLFREKDAGDSEKFPFPEIKEVRVSIEGKPNALYSKPLST